MVSLAWFAHTWKLAERVKVAMGVSRKFSRGSNVDILLIILRLPTIQCKWTFTKRFPFSTPQRKVPMKARAPFASVLKSFSSGAVGYTSLPQRCTFSHLLQRLLNWRKNVVIIVNSTQMSLKWTWTISDYICGSHFSVLVEQSSPLQSFVRIVFYTSAIRNTFAFHKLPNIHFCEHFLQISHNLRTINAQINIRGKKSRTLDTLAKLFHCILTRLSDNLKNYWN